MIYANINQDFKTFLIVLFSVLGFGILFILVLFIKDSIIHFKQDREILAENVTAKWRLVKEIKKYIKKIGSFGAATFIYIDIDDFNDVNETFEKPVGDIVLKGIVERIIKKLPTRASVCKYNNDEFLIFIKNEDNQEIIQKLCDDILETIRKPLMIDEDNQVFLTASIGVCVFPQAGINFKEIIKNLEITTFVSKRDGGNTITNFYSTLFDDESKNIEFYKQIKEAIHKKEFVLHYQPIINFNDNSLYGTEALMRWNHPSRGVLMPEKFIKVMEQSGDIRWVGEWGIENMIKHLQEVNDRFPDNNIIFSLNLSPKQLVNANFASDLIETVKRNLVDSKKIMFEINDYLIYEKITAIKTNVIKLKDYGFKIAIDSFELDQHSVQKIQETPVDVIKLGKEFLNNIENNFTKEKVLIQLMNYAKENNCLIMAEGVETKKAYEYIKGLNISVGSGYYFSRPQQIEDFIEYVNNFTWQN